MKKRNHESSEAEFVANLLAVSGITTVLHASGEIVTKVSVSRDGDFEIEAEESPIYEGFFAHLCGRDDPSRILSNRTSKIHYPLGQQSFVTQLRTSLAATKAILLGDVSGRLHLCETDCYQRNHHWSESIIDAWATTLDIDFDSTESLWVELQMKSEELVGSNWGLVWECYRILEKRELNLSDLDSVPLQPNRIAPVTMSSARKIIEEALQNSLELLDEQ